VYLVFVIYPYIVVIGRKRLLGNIDLPTFPHLLPSCYQRTSDRGSGRGLTWGTLGHMTPIEALIVTPEGNAYIEVIEPKWQNIKSIVGGWLEAVGGVLGEWTAYGDEEGNLKGLQPNGLAAGFIMAMNGRPVAPVGTVVFVGQRWVGGEDGYEEVSIPDELRSLAFPLG